MAKETGPSIERTIRKNVLSVSMTSAAALNRSSSSSRKKFCTALFMLYIARSTYIPQASIASNAPSSSSLLSKVLKELPETDKYRPEYIDRFRTLAKSVAACQQPEGYWTRSMLDPEHAPGPETSGTAFFTYGLLWGMNNGLLDKAAYQPVVMKAWNYLTTVALQPDGRIGYVQPIGEKAIPGQVVDANSTANFGVGAFLLAACEMVRFLNAD